VITGYWWAVGSSFMTIRLDDFSGDYEYRPFDVVNQAVQADSMTEFLRATPAGDYIAISVVFDGRTNVSESLYVMLESLGSTMIRSVLPGQSWAFIARKGSPGTKLESLTNDSAVVSLQVPNVYRFGSGAMSMPPTAIPYSWDHLHWMWSGPPGTAVGVAVTATKADGTRDTLRIFPSSPADVDLSSLNALTGPYATAQVHALLTSNDPLVTPVLKDWWVDMVPQGDLAVSARSIGPAPPIQQGGTFVFPVTVYNIGFRSVDSGTVVVSLYDRFNKSRAIAAAGFGLLNPGDSALTSFPLNSGEFPRHVTLEVSALPAVGTDLVAANNKAYYSFDVSAGLTARMQVYADGIQLMDGDYVSPHPQLVIRPVDAQEGARLQLSIDNVPVGQSVAGEGSFAPELSDGSHLLQMNVIDSYPNGTVDTLRSALTVNVASTLRILHPLNYPNPFRTETYFTFVLTGGQVPDEVRISIFTVSGRKIRELVAFAGWLQIGFNKVHWDGRDDDGDEVANGYYFYKLQVKGGGKTESIIERLAKVQ
jgi:Interleukin-like EMT inducer